MERRRIITRGGAAGTVLTLLLSSLLACSSVRGDQALAILNVSLASGLPSFTSFRFSVTGRADVRAFETPYHPERPLRFGYYLPGPNGPVTVHVEALAAGCPVGDGTADVDVQVGHVLPAVAVIVAPRPSVDAGCVPPGDASSTDSDARDAGADARDASDASADTALDAAPDRPATDAAPSDAGGGDGAPTDGRAADATMPACLAATRTCPGAAACCPNLVCGTTSLGQVCCGNVGVGCTRSDGTECCGNLECMGNRCCQPATRTCTGTECCAGLVCGTNSLGRVCCGNAGAPCTLADGTECCGNLECMGQTCRAP